MIQVYKPSNQDYVHNGDITLMPTSCVLSAKLNGEWELEVECLPDEEGRFRELVNGAVVSVPTPWSERQLYRIYDSETTEAGCIARARPIFMDSQNDVFILDKRPTECSGQEALDTLCSGTKYSGRSNIVAQSTAYYVRKNLIEALCSDDEQSFLNRWGGEVRYDNYTVIINDRIGADRGLRVEFGRNIESIKESINSEELTTRIYPVGYNGRMISGDTPYVDSPYIANYPIVHARELKCDDIKLKADLGENEDGQEGDIICENQAALDQALKQRCQEQYDAEVDIIQANYEVDMVDLSTKAEYEEYKHLEHVELGDTVHVRHKRLGIDVKARVVQIEYDCLRRKNNKLYIGDFRRDYFERLNGVTQKLQQLQQDIDDTAKHAAQLVQDASDRLNDLIAENSGLYCTVQDAGGGGQIVLLHDKKTLAESTNVIKLTADAIGFSTDGGKTYPFGFTIDGEFVANILSAHGINAEWINTGILQSAPDENGERNFFLNLETGECIVGNLSIAGKDMTDTLNDYIVRVEQEYYLSTSNTELLGGEWSTTQPPWEDKKFLWNRQHVYHGDGTDEYQPSETGVCITGNTGNSIHVLRAQGNYGESQEKIQDWVDRHVRLNMPLDITDAEFNALALDDSVLLRVLNHTTHEHVFLYGVIVNIYDVGEYESFPDYRAITFVVQGMTSNGNGVKSVELEYCTSTSETENTHTTEWGSAVPEVKDGTYIWARQKVTYVDGSIAYTGEYCMTKTMGDIAQGKVDAQTQLDIFNKLTNNGALEGIYMKDGKLYINATYIQTGTLQGITVKVGGKDNGNGRFEVYDNSGTLKGWWDRDGIHAETGTFNGTYGGTISATKITGGTLNADVVYGGNISASQITSGTLSAGIIKGGTLTLGGPNNGNGTIKILDASGNEIGSWTNAGITITSGSIDVSKVSVASGSGGISAGQGRLPGNVATDGIVMYYGTAQGLGGGYCLAAETGCRISAGLSGSANVYVNESACGLQGKFINVDNSMILRVISNTGPRFVELIEFSYDNKKTIFRGTVDFSNCTVIGL